MITHSSLSLATDGTVKPYIEPTIPITPQVSLVAQEYNKATIYTEKNNFKKAAQILRRVVKDLEFKEAYVNLGNCYRALGEDREMFKCYERALDPRVLAINNDGGMAILHALNNLGLAHYTFGRDDKAVECYLRATSVKEDFWEAWWNCSTATLRKASSGDLGAFKAGWEYYRARFLKKPPVVLKNKREGLMYWKVGSECKDLVVLVEQGIGDSIMFGRYLSWLKRDFVSGDIYVQCMPELDCIFSDFKTVRDATDIVSDDLVAYPICSLGEVYGSEIPSGDWLRDKMLDKHSFPVSEKPNVGIVFAGSDTHANNKYRSVNVHRFHKLSRIANLYCLSPNFSGNKYVNSLDIASWEDTARYIRGLDLVISVDTSVVHFAGSLGVEVWMLQPYRETDFRWGNGVDKSVWYPNVWVYDNPQSWETVFNRVESDLAEKFYVYS